MKESIQIRCAIEGFCAQMIAEEIHTSKGQRTLKEMQRLLEQQECLALNAAGNTETLERFMEYDHQFHQELINYAENREFQQTFQRLVYLIHLTTAKALLVPGRIKDTLDEHRQFYSALKAGKADAAYRLLMAHLLMPLSMDLTDNEYRKSAT